VQNQRDWEGQRSELTCKERARAHWQTESKAQINMQKEKGADSN
jgi:hypothetical protein